MSTYFSKYLIFLVIILYPFGVYSQSVDQKNNIENKISSQIVEQIQSLTKEIDKTQKAIQGYDQKIRNVANASDKEQMVNEKIQLEKKLAEQRYTLEQIATGAVDLSLFEEATAEEFSWQAELKDILKPMFSELKKITERPRQIEQLRSERKAIDVRVEAATLAVEEIKELMAAVESDQANLSLQALLSEWEKKQESLVSERQLIDFQLNEKLSYGESRGAAITNAIKNFFTGRGLNLLLAIGAFSVTFIIFRYISHRLEKRISRGQDKDRRILARLTHIIFQVLTVLLSLLALMATFYAVSDWLMLTLLLILLVGIVFALRHSLPRYLDEARLLLNMGAVREGERVIYNGLPWKVSRINIHSDLVNPALSGGRLRLPMTEMLNLISRRWSKNEPWFPCKPDDYVIMNDDTFGRVELQTPEHVLLDVLGGSTKTYTTSNFIEQTPRNLSTGFGLFVSFGLDYGLQDKITTEVLVQLESFLAKRFENSEFNQFLQTLKVAFDEAAASSLNVRIITLFSGDAAGDYFSLQRFIHCAVVDACNQYQWSIPFNQLTVHMESEFTDE